MQSDFNQTLHRGHNDSNRDMIGNQFDKIVYSVAIEDYMPFNYVLRKNDILTSLDMNKIIPFVGNETMRNDLTKLTIATRPARPTALEQIEQIKSEHPDLYDALANDNPDLIR